jgi:hypothetical protein
MTKPITISTPVLAAIIKWSYQESDRPHLRTVLFENGRAIATDGHRLVVLPIKTNSHRLLVDSQHLAAAIAAQRDLKVTRAEREIGIEPSGPNVTLTIDKGISVTVPARNPESFPPWSQVIPKVDQDAKAPHGYILDPRYLAAIAEVNTALAPHAQRGVRVVAWSPTDEDGQQLGAMLFEGYEGVRFVVMPMRCV